jgi:hypothetical protein
LRPGSFPEDTQTGRRDNRQRRQRSNEAPHLHTVNIDVQLAGAVQQVHVPDEVEGSTGNKAFGDSWPGARRRSDHKATRRLAAAEDQAQRRNS